MHRKAMVTSYFDARVTVPMIRLRGRWLTQAGFLEGDALRIEVEERRLVLTRPEGPVPTRSPFREEH
jgi:hypothetical protein